MKMTGAQAVVAALKKEGVDVVFGYPGGVALPLYDALYDSGIEHILTRHEQGAAHAADGFARSSGKVGVCLATSGPGATNLITGIATAYMDSAPIVCITSQVITASLGKDAFQEADMRGITAPITKFNVLMNEAEQLPATIAKAFYIARTGRPGPVVIDIPKDLFTAEIEYVEPAAPEESLPGYKPIFAGDEAAVDAVAEALRWSHFPVLVVGNGAVISGVSDALVEFVNKTNIPVVSTLMGLGAMPADHPNFIGMVGMHGLYAANMAVQHSDLLIAVGMRFSDRVTGKVSRFAPAARIAHFDIDKAEINKNIKVDYQVVADLAWSMPLLAAKASARDITDWHKQIHTWQQEHPLAFDAQAEGQLKPQRALQILDEKLNGEAIVVTDVGQHQMWCAQLLHMKKPRTFISSGGLGTMGFGLPAAMGAQVANPDKEVWAVCGDGGLMMNCQELATLAEHNLPVKVLLSNNRGLGMVRQWQRLFYNGRYSGSKHNLDQNFVALAEAMNCTGMRAETAEELAAAIDKARTINGPVVIDVRVDENENVLPMVAPGKEIDNIMEYEKEDC